MSSSLRDIRAVVLDMDGIIRIGKQAVSGAQEFLNFLKEKRIPAMILTNECRYSEAKIRHDLYDMKIEYPEEWPIYTSAMAVRDFLIKRFGKPDLNQNPKQVHYLGIIGEKGLRDAIKCVVKTINGDSEDDHELSNVQPRAKITSLPPLNDPDATLFLVIGTIFNLDVEDLEKALKWIQRGAQVIVTCPDIMDPELKGDFSLCMPRHVLHAVKINASTDYYNVGKPNALMALEVRKHFRTVVSEPNQILYIGDSLGTDLKLAEQNHWTSVAVLSGNLRREDLINQVIQPDYVFENLMDLRQAWEDSTN